MFSYKIRKKIIDWTGYFIYKKSDINYGIDLELDVVEKLGISPKTIFDVGANHGQTALFYHSIFPDANIYSFEPISSSFIKMSENVKFMDKIHPYHLALSNTTGETIINILSENNSQRNSLKTIFDSTKSKEKITLTTVDIFCSENNIPTIDLLKIDTEGYELEVLDGSTNMLENNSINLILCEVSLSPINKHNSKITSVIDFLYQYQYCIVGLYETNTNYIQDGIVYSNILFKKI